VSYISQLRADHQNEIGGCIRNVDVAYFMQSYKKSVIWQVEGLSIIFQYFMSYLLPWQCSKLIDQRKQA